MNNEKKGRGSFIAILVLVLVLGISIGYAALSTTLNINGSTTIGKSSWDVHFANVTKGGNSVGAASATLSDNNTTLTVSGITLSSPGSEYEVYVNVVNGGTIDANLSSLVKSGLSPAQQQYLSYNVTYAFNRPIKQNDLLKAGSFETLRISIKYNDNKSNAPSTSQSIGTMTFKLNYVQDKGTGVARAKLCKRATTLHSGTVGSTTVNFGQIGTTGTLASGDAFDCDVNGDGTYNESTEIFYYLKDLDSDSTSAVLIYNNVTSSDYVAYSKTNTLNGPTIASKYLPTISEWPNVSLTKAIRDIKSQDSDFIIKGFNYSGYAARLPSLSEVESCANESNCPITGVIWLETPKTQSNALYLFAPSLGYNQIRDDDVTSLTASVMPVIEVPKSRISY